MRYLKALGAALVVAALMAILGTAGASASVICSTTADPCPAGQAWPNGTVLDWSIPSGGSTRLVDTEGGTFDTCTGSTIKKKITNTGSATETVALEVTELTWGGCTFSTVTTELGKTEIHKIAGTSNGTVTSSATTKVTINTVLFGTCIYTVPTGKSIGEITEGIGAGSTFIANAVAEKASGSNAVCPATSKWTATYVLTTPSNTTLSVSASGS